MTVIIMTDSMWYECPVCGYDEVEEGQKFCQECGEVFEWKEEYE